MRKKYAVTATLAAVGAAVFAVDAFAGGGNAIADVINNVCLGAEACGTGIATLGCIGAWAASGTSNHGLVGPSLKGAGCGAGIGAAGELIGLAMPGGGAGASLTMPAALGISDYLHILSSMVS